MRFRVLVVSLVLAQPAFADKKIVDMTPGFKRELSACETQVSGLAKVIAKGRTASAQNPPDKVELDADLERLASGHAIVTAYCGDVRAMVTLLEDNAKAAYKSVEKAIDTHDNAVRKARRVAKQQLDELGPITSRLILKLNARVGQAPPEPKQHLKFPSGRAIELPKLPGAWGVSGSAVTDTATYVTGGITTTLTTRPHSTSCDAQRKLLAAKGDPTELELSADAKALGVEGAWRVTTRDRAPLVLTLLCMPGMIALADAPVQKRAEDLTAVMVAMLAARAKS